MSLILLLNPRSDTAINIKVDKVPYGTVEENTYIFLDAYLLFFVTIGISILIVI